MFYQILNDLKYWKNFYAKEFGKKIEEEDLYVLKLKLSELEKEFEKNFKKFEQNWKTWTTEDMIQFFKILSNHQ